jgi:DNA-binding LacI/PurR family transcriptional regulator
VFAPEIRQAVVDILSGSERPDGIYATTEPIGLEVLRTAATLGVKIPDDLMLIICTDREVVAANGVSVSTLNIYPKETASTAVSLLISVIEGREVEPRRIEIPTRLVIRGSTKRN